MTVLIKKSVSMLAAVGSCVAVVVTSRVEFYPRTTENHPATPQLIHVGSLRKLETLSFNIDPGSGPEHVNLHQRTKGISPFAIKKLYMLSQSHDALQFRLGPRIAPYLLLRSVERW